MIRNSILGLVTLGALVFSWQTVFQGRGGDSFLGGTAAYQPESWASYRYVEVGPASVTSYDFVFQVRCGLNGNPTNVRVAFDRQDEKNHNFVELTGDSLRIGRVEEDFVFTLAQNDNVHFEAGQTIDCRLKRRPHEVRLIIDGALVAAASDEVFHGGSIYVGTPNDSVDVPTARIQRVEDVYFTDDFMRPSDELGEWQVVAGDWGVRGLDNPSLSANAFTLEGHSSGRPAVALAGHSFWDSYSFRTAVCGAGCGTIGIVFYAHEATEEGRLASFYLLRWAPDGGVLAENGERQLLRYTNGAKHVLAEAMGGYRADQWYTLEIKIHGPRIRAFIDGALAFDVRDPLAVGGKFGLYSECDTPGCARKAKFDDVSLRRNEDVLNDFSDGTTANWVRFAGNWHVADGQYRVTASAPARSVTGLPDWKNYRLEAEVQPREAEWVGLTAAYLDEASHLLYRVSNSGQQELVRYANGDREVLARVERPPQGWPDGAARLALTLRQGAVAAEANGEPQMEAWIGPGLRGRAGLYAENAGSAAFDNVAVEFTDGMKSILNVNPVFASEVSMANWAAAESDWTKARSSVVGTYFTDARVHRMECHGDVEFAVNVEKADRLRQLRMSIGTAETDLETGYHLVLKRKEETGSDSWAPASSDPSPEPGAPAEEEGDWTARLYHRDTVLLSRTLPLGVTPSDLRFSRNGTMLIGYVNGEPVVQSRASSPALGRRIAYAHSGGTIQPKQNRVACSNAWCYSFRQATTDWRVASGTWEVTNRWQCDPRWTFFSGRSSRLACIWNKRQFENDVCIDLAAGIKMDRNRGGRYEYASDLNLTIAADGRDLTSGYSFLFGAHQNKATLILRGEQEVARSHRQIPIHTNIHRRWFHLKVARHGHKLLYWIDDELVLEYDDPDPLPGRQIALWTWNNGIMVAQVRISSLGRGELEPPSRKIRSAPICIYD